MVHAPFKQVKILKFADIYKSSVGKVMYKLYTETAIIPSQKCMLKNTNVHDICTRHRQDFIIPFCKNYTFHSSFLCEGPKLWNTLPRFLKKI